MVGSGAGFECHFGWLEFGEERFELRTPDLAPQDWTLLLVDAVDRENMLGGIDRDTFKFHVGGPFMVWFTDPMVAHLMPLGRPP